MPPHHRLSVAPLRKRACHSQALQSCPWPLSQAALPIHKLTLSIWGRTGPQQQELWALAVLPVGSLRVPHLQARAVVSGLCGATWGAPWLAGASLPPCPLPTP